MERRNDAANSGPIDISGKGIQSSPSNPLSGSCHGHLPATLTFDKGPKKSWPAVACTPTQWQAGILQLEPGAP